MSVQEFYNELKNLAPYNNQNLEYRDTLSKILKTYVENLSSIDEDEKIHNWEKHIRNVDNIVKRLKDIAMASYKGQPSSAYNKFKYLIKDFSNNLIFTILNKDTHFYRMRVFEKQRTNITYEDMFHIPINKRRTVKTQRYSTPGYPCLYLGTSIYSCWEEMCRPFMNNCWVSLLKNTENLNLLDLRFPSEEIFTNNFQKYIYVFPFIISCMIPVKNVDDIYKPEYIIPQLFIEWIINNENYDGIFYTISHKNNDFDYSLRKNENIAIPIKSPLDKAKYCPILKRMFLITNPANNEIEQLRDPYPIDGGDLDENIQELNYRTSNFGCLEGRLNDNRYYQLHELP